MANLFSSLNELYCSLTKGIISESVATYKRHHRCYKSLKGIILTSDATMRAGKKCIAMYIVRTWMAFVSACHCCSITAGLAKPWASNTVVYDCVQHETVYKLGQAPAGSSPDSQQLSWKAGFGRLRLRHCNVSCCCLL